MKRLLDVVASLVGLVVLGPLILALAVAIRRGSPGPGILGQARVGRNGKPFLCRKLRTMAADTAQAATHDTPASAVTPLGIRLRRWKLDELPQLWNVLRGEMSLVGPRPCLPMQRDVIEARERLGVHALRPGITGLAQVNGVDMSTPDRLAAVDAAYGASQTLRGDLVLIVRTLRGAGRGDHVASR